MQVINSRNRIELLGEIRKLNGVHDRVYVPLRPTLEITEALITQCPNIKEIYCPPSLYLQVSKKVLKHLGEKNIALKQGEFTAGRPKKYSEDLIKQLHANKQNGKSAKVISEDFDIPLRTVYYHLKNGIE
jgi:hypothetical protein